MSGGRMGGDQHDRFWLGQGCLNLSVVLKSILLVDDDPSIRKVAELSLRRLGGWEVTVASSGREALALVQTFRPDLIVLDAIMPGMDGPSTLAALRKEVATRTTPVIFLTADSDPAAPERYAALGALGMVAKPFDALKLPDLVRALFAKAPASR